MVAYITDPALEQRRIESAALQAQQKVLSPQGSQSPGNQKKYKEIENEIKIKKKSKKIRKKKSSDFW